MSGQGHISNLQQLPQPGSLSSRGYSDSSVPGCRASRNKSENHCDLNGPSPGLQNDLAAPVYRDGAKSPLSSRVKARANLHLPCFQSLGISSRIPEPLCTPPDDFSDPKPSTPACINSRSSSYPPCRMPNTPSPDRLEMAESSSKAELRNEVSISNLSTEAPSVNPLPGPVAQSKEFTEAQDVVEQGTDATHDDSVLTAANWTSEVIEAAVSTIDVNSSSNIIVLSHSQPCPMPSETLHQQTPSAFHDLMLSIQGKISTNNRYIHITHAVPVKFDMAHIPMSPACTPSTAAASNAPADYFSPQTNVFSNAVVAADHMTTLDTSAPSSPHPVVPPATVHISLLERYIPPTSSEEYVNLFSPEGPSVLVDRLVELSPDGGSLILIYPTAAGAKTFASTYLGPLLHPLLRTMCSINNLSMDFGAGVGSIGAVDKMLPFEEMSRKITLLLRKLGRATSSSRRAPKLSLIHSSKQWIDMPRKTWSEWWVRQEKPRMTAVVDRYLKRGTMLPTPIAGQEVTAATLVQEVVDGVSEHRQYAEYDVAREGIEVGVFVIKRTA